MIKNQISSIDSYLNLRESYIQDEEALKANQYFRNSGKHFTAHDIIQYPEFPFRVVQKQCFYNAQVLSGLDDTLAYFEGFYCPTGFVPVPHAWCVNKSGKVVDPTCQTFGFQVDEYFGLEIDRNMFLNYIIKHAGTESQLNEYLKRELALSRVSHLL